MARDWKNERNNVPVALPPTPPDSEQSDEDNSDQNLSPPISTTEFALPPPTSEPTEVLEADKKTPDSWLSRDPRLIRRT